MKTYTREEVEQLMKQTVDCCATSAHYPTTVIPDEPYMRDRYYARQDILAYKEKLVKFLLDNS